MIVVSECMNKIFAASQQSEIVINVCFPECFDPNSAIALNQLQNFTPMSRSAMDVLPLEQLDYNYTARIILLAEAAVDQEVVEAAFKASIG